MEKIIDFIQVLWNVNKVILHIVLLQVVREPTMPMTMLHRPILLLYRRAQLHYTIEVVHILD